jgi:hypothetical protein
MEFHAAICQRPPVMLDKGASMAAALAAVAEAAERGVRLITFPEAFLPGYPTWVWRLRPGADMALGNEIHRQLQRNAIDISAGDLDPLRDAAAKHGMVIVMGMHEFDSAFSGSTLFNTVVVIGDDGTILNKHRKLMPTNPERMVWGMGDASGLAASAVSYAGKITCRWRAMRFTHSTWIFWWPLPGIAATCGPPACGISQKRAVAGSCHRQRRCKDRTFQPHFRAVHNSSRTRNGSIRAMPLPSNPVELSWPALA